MPRPRPPYPAETGLFGKPTIINNVETLANVPAIMEFGPGWFNAVGTAGSKGTKVFALSGKVLRTGLVEVPMGTPLRQIVFDIGGGAAPGRTCKAVQIGGPSGGCIPLARLDVQVDYESLKDLGAIMGSGGLVVVDDQTCMVDVAKFFMDFIQRESCGKCIPCREGTRRILEILERITAGKGARDGLDALQRFQGVIYMQRLAEVIRDTSLCGLGQTAPNPVLSTLRWFREEYEAHVYDRKCPAGVCKGLLKYSIDTQACRGCTLCAKRCPVGAIMGARKSPHYVVQEKCVRCGTCVEVCPVGAVSVQ
jgi:NADH:ubiquinone oxidoreductase subunit F (NADH-binding)/Pyruvate/2-oxoacid:ferredoxin oxidoreductase delta subunit